MPLPPSLRSRLDAQAGQSCPVLTVEEFFDGNTDVGSIGCNLNPAPPLDEFRQRFLEVRARDDVQDVLVHITEDMGDEWPFSDHVFVLTSAPMDDVARWLASLGADEPYVEEEWPGPTTFLPALKEGMHVVVVWWD